MKREDGTVVDVKAAAAARLPQAGKEPPVSSRVLADGVGYVRISTFAHRDAKAWSAAVPAQRGELIAQEVAELGAAITRVG